MNKTLLYNYLPTLSVPNDELDVFYSFTSGSGNVVFNEIHDNSDHFLDNDVTKINGSVYAGISNGDNNASSGSSNGTGNFAGNDGVQIAPYYDKENWTLFLNFSGASVPTGDKGMVLVDSAKNTYVSTLTDSADNTFLQVSQAAEASTGGGGATSKLRSVYFYTGDTSSIPTYSGSAWPYVYVQGTLSSDDAVSATLSTTGYDSKRLLLVNGKPAYQFTTDVNPTTAEGIGVGSIWSGFKSDGLQQTATVSGVATASSTACKGFTFAVNASNRLFFQYDNSSGETKTFTSINELGNKNIISLTKSSDSVAIMKHDFVDGKSSYENFYFASDFNNSLFWNVGRINEDDIACNKLNQFTGIIEDLVLFSGALPSGKSKSFSECFFFSDFSGKRKETVTKSKNQITGFSVNYSGVTGVGITGYQSILYSTVGGVEIYTQSGVTGVLSSGIQKTILTGTGISYTENVITGEFRSYNNSYASLYSNTDLAFLKRANSSESTPDTWRNIFEVNSQLYRDTGVGLVASFNTDYSGFKLDDSYVVSDGINVFKNGYAQYSGADYSISSGHLIFNETASSSDSIVYDYASGDQLLSGYDDPITGNGTVYIDSEDHFYKDIYLNGKKLIEGLNYLRDWGGQATTILKTTFTETGHLLFFPRVNGNTPTGVYHFNAKTGVAVNHVSADFNIVSEQVWLKRVKANRK